MRDPSVRSIVENRSGVELAGVFERIWSARGYETRVRFSGPDVHVEVSGETPAGVPREVRVWVTTTRRVTADMTSDFARTCRRADVEPYLAAVGAARLEAGARHPDVVVLDAATVAVEIREAGVEQFVRDLARESEESGPDRPEDRTNDRSVAEALAEGDPDGETDAAGDDADEDAVTRREAIKTASAYVLGSATLYLLVERLSDHVRRSPRLRAAIRRRAAWVESRLPEVSLPRIEWSVPTPDPFSGRRAADREFAAADRPANATAVPYEDLRTDPETYRGTAVVYRGRVSNTIERDGRRRATITVENSAGRPSGEVIARWSTGRFFEDAVSFRLLDDDRVRIWGTVDGEARASSGPTLPLVNVTALEEA